MVQTRTRGRAAPKREEFHKKDPYFLRAVGKALEAQEILKRSPSAVSLAEMASHLNLTKSSALRILHTLEACKYLQKKEDGRYASPENGANKVSGESVQRLIQAADGPLRELVREFRETVGLGVLFENHIEVVSVVESPELIRMGNTVGRILPPHASALGKCIAAFQSEARREKLLRSYGIVRITQNTIVDELRLKEEFERIAARGYSIDEEESTLHGHCFGAPITSPAGEVVAAISISPVLSRVPVRGREKMIAAIQRTAREISGALKS
ncbi:MAG: IclR family transcriptional regulator [Acidobacteria bacterium]|nr:IclR family transcriptional regulator [Acidobacteriota bacterium]